MMKITYVKGITQAFIYISIKILSKKECVLRYKERRPISILKNPTDHLMKKKGTE